VSVELEERAVGICVGTYVEKDTYLGYQSRESHILIPRSALDGYGWPGFVDPRACIVVGW
jgi:hypothetical protein